MQFMNQRQHDTRFMNFFNSNLCINDGYCCNLLMSTHFPLSLTHSLALSCVVQKNVFKLMEFMNQNILCVFFLKYFSMIKEKDLNFMKKKTLFHLFFRSEEMFTICHEKLVLFLLENLNEISPSFQEVAVNFKSFASPPTHFKHEHDDGMLKFFTNL